MRSPLEMFHTMHELIRLLRSVCKLFARSALQPPRAGVVCSKSMKGQKRKKEPGLL
ncbi:hypothetical protein ACIOAU_17295 [Pseudomonas sp. NPDC088322]|uniref:hypothetical protein n=1 Tax=Pseudomonas sp. NPDC088322 TaxID=3364452 RepID=UPI0037F3F10D